MANPRSNLAAARCKIAPADLGIHDLFTFASIRVHSRFSIFLQRVGAAGRIALPEMKEVSRKMRDTAGGTPALPLKKQLLRSTIHNPRSLHPLRPFAT
jgi:hypothetical protein